MTGRERRPGNWLIYDNARQLSVDNARQRGCMMNRQWPFESSPRLVIRPSCWKQPGRVSPVLDKKFPAPVLFMSTFYTVGQYFEAFFALPEPPYPSFSRAKGAQE